MTPPSSPYKGLRSFDDTEIDARLFFGREREREVIAANMLAARLTVLYGPSGVGKSSVLRAGVARQLRELPERPLVIVFSSWAEAPAQALADTVAEAAGIESGGSLVDVLAEAARLHDEVFVILDQAEELFLYDEDRFVAEFPELVNRPDLRVNVLLSVRDDALSRLDVFKSRIPDVLGNYLRLDRLDRDAGRSAIVRPVESWSGLANGAGPVGVEPELVEAVLDEVGAGLIDAGLGGRGAAEDLAGPGIETPYLQLVMQRVWDEERAAGSKLLRLETLRRLGGAQEIVAEHLEAAVDALAPSERDTAARLFNHLVTPSGTKVAHGAGDLAGYAGVPEDRVLPVLTRLVEGRILRTVARDGRGEPRYEIFHDVLAGAVLGWRSRHEADRRFERERAQARQRNRRLALVAASALVGLAVATGLAVYAFSQRSEAREQSRVAKARELEASAVAELGEHPGRALQLAVESVGLARGPQSEDVLRRSLLASRLRRVITARDPLAVAFAGEDVATVERDGRLRLTSPQGTQRTFELAAEGGKIDAATFDATGTFVATAEHGLDAVRLSEVQAIRRSGTYAVPARVVDLAIGGIGVAAACRGGTTVVFLNGMELRFRVPGEPTDVALSADDRLLAVSSGDRVHIWEVETKKLLTVVQDRANVLDVALAAGERLVTAAADSAARVWQLPGGTLVNVMIGHRNLATVVAASPDGTRIVTASTDLTARVWETDTARPLGVLAGHRAPLDAAAFDSSGSRVVTGSRDGSARIWEARLDPELSTLATFRKPVVDVSFQAPGRVEAVTDDGVVHVLDERSGRELERRAGVLPDPRAQYDNRVATASGDNVVLRGPGGARALRGHRDVVTGVAFSADGRLLVSSSRDHHARLWDGVSGKPIRTLRGHFAVVSGASFNPDGRWVVTAGPGTAGLFEVRTGKLIFYLRGHAGKLLSARFDPRGRRIVTGGMDGTVRTYACDICGDLDDLLSLARKRLEATR